MPTIRLELSPDLARAVRPDVPEGGAAWDEEVAAGETLGRLLGRVAQVYPGFRSVYDPETRRVADGLSVAVNGRGYNLVGGLTYTLHDGDTVSARKL